MVRDALTRGHEAEVTTRPLNDRGLVPSTNTYSGALIKRPYSSEIPMPLTARLSRAENSCLFWESRSIGRSPI